MQCLQKGDKIAQKDNRFARNELPIDEKCDKERALSIFLKWRYGGRFQGEHDDVCKSWQT